VIHHVAKVFSDVEVFLAAVMTKFTFQRGATVKAIIFCPVMLLHKFYTRLRTGAGIELYLFLNTKGKTRAISNA
jgi:hypothetical protein